MGLIAFGQVGITKIHFEGGRKMKKLAGAVICIVFAFGAGNVFAQPLKKHTFEIGPEISYRVYKEPGVMKEEGWIRTARNSINVWALNDQSFEMIRDWIREMRMDPNETFDIEELSTGEMITANARQLRNSGVNREALMRVGQGVGRWRNGKKRRMEEEDADVIDLTDELPPEGLWISPTGDYIAVVEHLAAIASDPDVFGLPDSYRDSGNIKVLRDAAEDLIRGGWIRFRYLSGVYLFEVDSIQRRLGTIEDVLVKVGAFEGESVSISQAEPKADYEGTVQDVYDKRIGRFAANPPGEITLDWRIT